MSIDPSRDRAAVELLVALLRSELGSAPAPPVDAVVAADWQALEHAAERHGLAPFLASLLAPCAGLVPPEVLERCELRARGNRMRNRLVGALSRAIDARLAAARTPLLLLKGAALLHRLYGEEGPRRLSDIDVLVRRDALDVASAALAEIGFEPAATREEHFFRRDMHLRFRSPQAGSIAVELHWDLSEPYRPYAFDLDAIWATARPLGRDWSALHTMSPEHEIAYLCLHLERHAVVYRYVLPRDDWFGVLLRGTGARLIWLYDVALYLRQRGSAVDWEQVVDCSARWGIATHVRAALEMCRRVFLVEPPAIERLAAGRVGFVESVACRALASGGAAEGSRRYRDATLALNVSAYLTPGAAYLRQRYGAGAPLSLLRLLHLARAGATTATALFAILRRDAAEGTATSAANGQQAATGADDLGKRGLPLASPDLMAESCRTSIAVYDPEHDAVHRLNGAAARLLGLCDGSRTVAEIAAELRGGVGAGAELTDADVEATIDLLVRGGLVAPGTAPWGPPLNGQIQRLRMVAEILARFDCRAVIETGTFLGSTTAYFMRNTRGTVYTVEKNTEYFARASQRLHGESNVRLFLGDSRQVLRTLGEDPSVPKQGVLFYLDAHDCSDAPLRDELVVIAATWTESVIVIDDFEVPGDRGYGFDHWTDGDRLCLDRMPSLDALNLVPFFPAAPSSEETGPRRGCVVLAPPPLVAMVASVPSLRVSRAERNEQAGAYDSGQFKAKVQ